MADGPSPEAIRRATLLICRFLAEDYPGVMFVPADADDPDAVLLEFGREAGADGGQPDIGRGAPGGAPVRRADDDAD